MQAENGPRVTVTKSGVRQVSPADILRSRAGREQIKQTQALAHRTREIRGADKSR